MEAVEAVSSQKVYDGGSWGSIFSKVFSLDAVGALSPFPIDILYVVWR